MESELDGLEPPRRTRDQDQDIVTMPSNSDADLAMIVVSDTRKSALLKAGEEQMGKIGKREGRLARALIEIWWVLIGTYQVG